MIEETYECSLCGPLAHNLFLSGDKTYHMRADSETDEWCDGAVTPICAAATRPPLTRDLLLSEITRSLRATMPDRAEEYVKELEQRLPSDGLLAKMAMAFHWANDVGAQAMNMRSVFVKGGPMDDSVRKLERAMAKISAAEFGEALRHRPASFFDDRDAD